LTRILFEPRHGRKHKKAGAPSWFTGNASGPV